jgi:hypothetical protein
MGPRKRLQRRTPKKTPDLKTIVKGKFIPRKEHRSPLEIVMRPFTKGKGVVDKLA